MDVSMNGKLTSLLDSCHLTISAVVATVLYWRQVRVALDTLLNVCLANPIPRPTGGRAYVGARTGVSGGIWGRQVDNVTDDAWSGNLTGTQPPLFRVSRYAEEKL